MSQLDPTDVYPGRLPRVGSLALTHAGKVRDIYALDDERLLFVTSDRVSAFDVLMPRGIPHKGRALTAVAAHWFRRTEDIVPNHLLSTDVADVPGLNAEERALLDGRIMIVRRLRPTTVEWVVRGYLVGSGWKEYERAGSVCGIPLPAGIPFCGALPQPLLTPTTKDDGHDEPLTPDQARERVGGALFDEAQRIAQALFARGTQELEQHGILLADTKFEFGLEPSERESERVVLIDEALTQDSSRFWPREQYRPGHIQPSYDKQILRDWLETLDWNKEPPAPEIPDDIVEQVSRRYLEVCRTITGTLPPGVPRDALSGRHDGARGSAS